MVDGIAERPELGDRKVDVLLALYRAAFEEMTWRRNAGYRTIILGLAYCGILLTMVAFNASMAMSVRSCLAAIIFLASVFGTGYMVSNYYKYTAALGRMVLVEQYLGAYEKDFLGELGRLMPASRRELPETRLSRNPVCLWSIVALFAGGATTAVAILLI